MAGGDIVLQFVWPSTDSRADMRTVQIKQLDENGQLQDVYKFFHPQIVGSDSGVTYFQRMNFATKLFEAAGHIEWSSNHSANVYFGLERVMSHLHFVT
ncbi:hypothetical protein BC629DRAFT_1532479 [Irpex lacteus]|nr:hypothetical protein BC629DRAFT_1532479 [Irpex lacteus]